jgi:hypothetical protein
MTNDRCSARTENVLRIQETEGNEGRGSRSAHGRAGSAPAGRVEPLTTGRKDKTFAKNVVGLVKRIDRWVGRQVGRLEPHQRRTLAFWMGGCAALSVVVGGVVYLVMKRNGTLPPETESDPFSTAAGIAVVFAYVGVKALTYKEPALTPDQHYQRELRDAWKEERSLRDIKPWSQFMAWPQPRAGEVAVLIVRRDPDGGFTADTFDTLPADSAAETGAELIWEARRHAEQAEVDVIAAHELKQTRERDRPGARRDAEQQARADSQAVERASRVAAELASAEERDRRTEAEGLAAAMRHTARNPRR